MGTLTILFVEDVAAAARFYQEGLGWRARVDTDRYVELDGGVGLMRRDAAAGFAGAERAAKLGSQDGLRAELYVSVANVEAAWARLVEAGGQPLSAPAQRPWGDRAGYVLDGDGYIVAVAARGASKVKAQDLRPIVESDRAGVQAFLTRRWGSPMVQREEVAVDASTLPGFVFDEAGTVSGLVTYREGADELEIITIDSADGGRGIGRALIESVFAAAAERRVLVTTTNDNLPALGFYQRLGFRIRGVRPGAITRARANAPSIPMTGHSDLPIFDELELVWTP